MEYSKEEVEIDILIDLLQEKDEKEKNKDEN
jgi:hypothetical protein